MFQDKNEKKYYNENYYSSQMITPSSVTLYNPYVHSFVTLSEYGKFLQKQFVEKYLLCL